MSATAVRTGAVPAGRALRGRGEGDRGLIESILPSHVAAAEVIGTELAEQLFVDEAAAVRSASSERRREFVSVRGCARQAFAHLGLPRPPLVPGPYGASAWPAGVVGSMTHCPGYRGAAVARSAEYVGVGIDAETDLPLPPGVLDRISSADERDHLATLPHGTCWDRLLFSAKESAIKATFPGLGRPLRFGDIEVRLDSGGHCSVSLLDCSRRDSGSHGGSILGRWTRESGLVCTMVVIHPVRRDPS